MTQASIRILPTFFSIVVALSILWLNEGALSAFLNIFSRARDSSAGRSVRKLLISSIFLRDTVVEGYLRLIATYDQRQFRTS